MNHKPKTKAKTFLSIDINNHNFTYNDVYILQKENNRIKIRF